MVGKKHSQIIVSILCLRVILQNKIHLLVHFFKFVLKRLHLVARGDLLPRFCPCRCRQLRLESVHHVCSLLHLRTRVPLVQTTLK